MLTYCFFSAQYFPHVGGVERYTYNIAKELLARGNRVIIVTSLLDGCSDYEISPEGIVIYRVPAKIFVGDRLPVSWMNQQTKKVFQLLEAENIDRIVIQTRLYTLSLLAAKFAKKHNLPCIIIEHGSSYIGIPNPIIQRGEMVYEKFLASLIKKYCRNFCAVSQTSGDWIKEFDLKCKAVLYNSTIVKPNEENRMHVREEFKIPEDNQIVVFVGRMIPEKGMAQLIEAVKEYNLKKEIFTLLLIGDGPMYEALQKEAEKNIVFLGNCEHDRVMNVLYDSDIFCLPSDSEGFPTSLLEAAMCRCFSIVSPYGGSKEMTSDERYGILMEGNQKGHILAALEKVANMDNATKEEILENAYQRVMNEFTWTRTCDRLESLPWETYK